MSNLVELNDENFREHYQNNDIVVVDFWAPWCGPCRMFAPIFEEVAKNNPDIFFGKVDTEKNPKLGIHFQVRSIPTLMIIREGIEVFYHSGMVSETDLQNVIDKVKALDMKEVEKKIEKD